MTELQKIIIGLLGLSHPEVFALRKPVAAATAAPEAPAVTESSSANGRARATREGGEIRACASMAPKILG